LIPNVFAVPPGASRRLDVLLKEIRDELRVVTPGGGVDAYAYHVHPPVVRHPGVLGLGVCPLQVEVVDVRSGDPAHRRAVVGDAVPAHLQSAECRGDLLVRRQEAEDQKPGRKPRERERAV